MLTLRPTITNKLNRYNMSLTTLGDNEENDKQCNIDLVSGRLIDDRCESVLEYLIPYYKSNMSAEQYKNAMKALRTIYYGNQ